AVIDAFRALIPSAPAGDMNRPAADTLLFACLYLLQLENTGMISPITGFRGSIPEFRELCADPGQWPDAELIDYFQTHMETLRGCDQQRNLTSGLLSTPPLATDVTDPLASAQSCGPGPLRIALQQAAITMGIDPAQPRQPGHLSTRAFASRIETILFAVSGRSPERPLRDDATGTRADVTSNLATELESRIAAAETKSYRLLDPSSPRGDHLRRYVSESFFRCHIVDPRAGAGARLIDVMDLMVTRYIDALDESALCPLHPRIPELKHLIIRDSHSNTIMLDHTRLTDIRLLRLQIAQHCLYGFLDPSDPCVVPAIIGMHTEFCGIRFPYIGHHFHTAADSVRNRLTKQYTGPVPEYIQTMSGRLAGLIAASKWLSEQELDMEAFGPNFPFTRCQFRLIMERIQAMHKIVPDTRGIPLELVFPWIFHARLTGETHSDQPGFGFDVVLPT
ncbi:hypothetical protein JXA80_13205, partial [bacterium]|nr:hypothetical protein [candidate division CSSED10-310 bacterium]